VKGMDSRWRIELLGRLRAEVAGLVVTRFRTQKTAALLAYLAVHRNRDHPREVLIELLWPGCHPRHGRNSLSQALSSLRHQLEPPGVPAGTVIVADRTNVRLHPDAFTTDVADFEAALGEASRARGRAQREPGLGAGGARAPSGAVHRDRPPTRHASWRGARIRPGHCDHSPSYRRRPRSRGTPPRPHASVPRCGRAACRVAPIRRARGGSAPRIGYVAERRDPEAGRGPWAAGGRPTDCCGGADTRATSVRAPGPRASRWYGHVPDGRERGRGSALDPHGPRWLPRRRDLRRVGGYLRPPQRCAGMCNGLPPNARAACRQCAHDPGHGRSGDRGSWVPGQGPGSGLAPAFRRPPGAGPVFRRDCGVAEAEPRAGRPVGGPRPVPPAWIHGARAALRGPLRWARRPGVSSPKGRPRPRRKPAASPHPVLRAVGRARWNRGVDARGTDPAASGRPASRWRRRCGCWSQWGVRCGSCRSQTSRR